GPDGRKTWSLIEDRYAPFGSSARSGADSARARARPPAGQVVLGSIPINRPRPYQGGSGVPPSSHQSQARGNMPPSQERSAPTLASSRRIAAHGLAKSVRQASSAAGAAGRERS